MQIEDRKNQGRGGMAKKKGVSADKMFFNDIDDDDEEYDLDDMGDIADMFDGDDLDDLDDLEDIDLDEMIDEDADEMLGGVAGPAGGGAGSGSGGSKADARGGDRKRRSSRNYDGDGIDDEEDLRPLGWQDDMDDEDLLEADLAEAEGRGGQVGGSAAGRGTGRGQDGGRGGRGKRDDASLDDPGDIGRRGGGGRGGQSGRGSTRDGYDDYGDYGDDGDHRPRQQRGKSHKSQQQRPEPRDQAKDDYYGSESSYGTGGAAADEGGTEDLDLPQWAVAIKSKLDGNVAHAFLLEGNIRDYIVSNIPIKDGIILGLDPYLDSFDVIASYDQAHGLTFDTVTISDDEGLPDYYKGRFIELMREAQASLDMPVTEEIPKDPVTIFTIIGKIMEMPPETLVDSEGGEYDRAKMLLFVDYPEMLVPQTPNSPREAERQLAIVINDLCRSQVVDDCGNCLIMMTDDMSSVSEKIRSTSSRVDRVNVPMPLLEDRKAFIHDVLADDEHRLYDGRMIFDCEEGVSEEYLAINTAGLARFQIEDIVLRSMADGVPITPALVKERKSEIVTNDYNDVIEILDPKHGFAEVGGMQQLKDFFRDEVINPIHRGELEAVPMGVLFMGPPGSGKSLPKDAWLPTPQGWRQAGDIAVGDQLFDVNGQPTNVAAVYQPGVKDIYTVTLRDGRVVECSGDHLWYVGRKSHGRIKWETMTVDEMLNRGIYAPNSDRTHQNRSKFFVPEAKAVQYSERILPVDPYVLGCFLGDGCRRPAGALELSSNDEFIVNTIAERYGCHAVKCKSSYSWHFKIQGLGDQGAQRVLLYAKDITKDSECLNLLSECYAIDKYIPQQYMVASVEQRLELLRGLMDTDGSIRRANGRYNVSFATTSPQLAHDVNLLAHSLGWASSVAVQKREGKPIENSKNPIIKERKYKHKSDLYEVRLRIPNAEKYLAFKLPRKRDIALEVQSVPDRRVYSRIAISDIQPAGYQTDTVCFTVEAPEHLYLVGDYVVTHNTMLAKAIAHESNMNCVNLNLGRILNKYLGGSEQNLDRALDCAMAMQPTIIFIDEIDEALPKRNGADQSGVSQRINKRLLEFFSQTEHRGQVMILAATNYPEKIDPAFKRAGRFDNRLPMFAPGKYDRARILHISAAKARYTISSFYSPDTVIKNPFVSLRNWLEQGNMPNLENSIYDMTDFDYVATGPLGEKYPVRVQIPKRLYRIIDKPKISLEEFYRACDILFPLGELPSRGGDEVGERELSDEEYRKALIDFCAMNAGIFGKDKRVYSFVANRLLYREMYFDRFGDLTLGKTGAELDVVINKCISLYRTFKAEQQKRFKEMLESGVIKDERDIPWSIVLDACSKTTAAVSGIKSMEDYALIDTSDTDYIPDEEYGRLSSNKTISYRERQEQLLTRMKLLAGDNENTSALLKS